MIRKSKWNFLFIILALLLLFSLVGVPKIAAAVMAETKGQVMTVQLE